MNLNIAIIADNIKSFSIIYMKADPLSKMTLPYAVFYEEDTPLSSNCLYITYGTDLPAHPAPDLFPSIISIGECPKIYYDISCEMIILNAETNIYALFNKIQQIFSFYNNWELRLQKTLESETPLPLIGDLAYEIFGNPLVCFNRMNRAEFLKYNKNDPETMKYYDVEPREGHFMSEDEENLIAAAPNLLETFSSRVPALYPKGSFRYDNIYCNIFEGEHFLGRLVVDNAYRDFISSDYALLQWLSVFIKDIMIKSANITLGISKKFESVMRCLLLDHDPYQKEFDEVLAQYHWNRYDTYRYVLIRPANIAVSENTSAEFALYLNSHLDGKYILIDHDSIIIIFNITQNFLTNDALLERLDFFMKSNPFKASVSTSFTDIADIWNYQLQAQQTYVIGEQTESQKSIHCFENLALTIMLENLKAQFSKEFFYTDAIKQLITYDLENNIDFCKTIRVYLDKNNNISHALQELHFCRSTFLYRIKRIEELSGLDLDDPETKLYLMMLFRICDLGEQ